jgi:hypothetical protein
MKAFVLALALACSVGCSSSDSRSAAPTIELLKAGDGEKRALRFTAKEGMKRTLTLDMKMKLSMSMDGQRIPAQQLPTQRTTIDLVVTSVAPNGDIRYEFVTRKPEILADGATPQAVVDAVKNAVAELEGMRGHAVVSNRGVTLDAEFQASNARQQTQQLVDSLRQSLAQITFPVPAEPVGVGATWKTTTTLKQNGLTMKQVAITELTHLEGDTMTLKFKSAQSAEPQKFTTNGVPAELASYFGAGEGETTIDLTGLIPTKAQMTLTSDMSLEAQGQKLGMSLDLALTMKGE